MKLCSSLEHLDLIKTLRKFSFITKLSGTFRCVCVCVYVVLYGAYNSQGLVRQVSKFILSVSVRGVFRFPYMQPLLTWQEDGVEPATCDARVNNRDHLYIGASVNIVYLLTFRCCMFQTK